MANSAFPSVLVTDHGGLTGIGDDDHTQYVLLAGRATGQIIVGGTAASEDLTLRATADATDGDIIFQSDPTTERMRMTSAGRLGIGAAPFSFVINGSTNLPQLLNAGTSADTRIIAFTNNAADANGPAMLLGKSRHATPGSHTVVVSGDSCGFIGFYGSDGADYLPVATINATVSTTPGSNDMPGALAIGTTADGGVGVTTRWSVNHAGNHTFAAPSSGTAVALSTGVASAVALAVTHTATVGYPVNVVGSNNSASGYVSFINVTYAAGSSANSFMQGNSDGDGSTDVEFQLRGDGEGFADGSWTPGGADYAEYFEWADGNPQNQDRRGMTVVLDGEKVKLASLADAPADIIGVVSAAPGFVAGAAALKWHDRYLRDAFGARVMEDYKVFSWIDMPLDSLGNVRENFTEEQARKHGITIPAFASYVIQQRRKLNPAFDPTAVYIPRSQRPEWDPIGMVGKVWVRKGQPVGDRWKLLKAGDTTNLYLVR